MRKFRPVFYGAWLYFRDKWLECYHWELSQKVTHKHLTPVMMDEHGRTYYEFPDPMSLPMIRAFKKEEFLEWMASSLTQDMLQTLAKNMRTSLAEALQNANKPETYSKKISAVLVMIDELENRKEKIIPFDLVINFLCAQIVREDEDPNEWNEQIHIEKCQYFAERQSDYQFFFQFSGLKSLSTLLDFSSQNWHDYIARSITEGRIFNEKMKLYSTGKVSEKVEKKQGRS